MLETSIQVRGWRTGYSMFDVYTERCWHTVRHHSGSYVYVAGFTVPPDEFLDGLAHASESRTNITKFPFGRQVQTFRTIVPSIEPRRDMNQEYVEPGPGMLLVAERSRWLRRPGWVGIQRAQYGILAGPEILYANAEDLRAAVEKIR